MGQIVDERRGDKWTPSLQAVVVVERDERGNLRLVRTTGKAAWMAAAQAHKEIGRSFRPPDPDAIMPSRYLDALIRVVERTKELALHIYVVEASS